MTDFKFQIGSDYHGYIYQETDFKANNKMMYKCRRGLEEGNGKRLFLFQKISGRWMAVEAPEDCSDPVGQGVRAFKTEDPHEDITIEGRYKWQYFDDGAPPGQRWNGLKRPFVHKLVN